MPSKPSEKLLCFAHERWLSVLLEFLGYSLSLISGETWPPFRTFSFQHILELRRSFWIWKKFTMLVLQMLSWVVYRVSLLCVYQLELLNPFIQLPSPTTAFCFFFFHWWTFTKYAFYKSVKSSVVFECLNLLWSRNHRAVLPPKLPQVFTTEIVCL